MDPRTHAAALVLLSVLATVAARADETKPGKATASPALSASIAKAPRAQKLSANEVANAVRTKLVATKMQRGATISEIHANPVESPDYDGVAIEVPTIPRKAGPLTVTAGVTFSRGETVVARTTVRLDLLLPPEAAIAEIPRGASMTLLIRKNLVEVRVPVVAVADSDIGSVMAVSIKPSGRQMRARAIDKDNALAVEE